MSKRSLTSGALIAALMVSTAAAREPVTLWFWGAPLNLQEVMQTQLIDPFNASQSDYELVIEFRNSVDNDVRVAVLANQGPDIVYTSGPSYVAGLAAAGKIEPMQPYIDKFGWSERLLQPAIDTCRMLDAIYCMPGSIISDGMFYNTKVLEENGWTVPTTKAELETILAEAKERGLYPSVAGNKGWQPVNQDYASIFLNQVVGPEQLHEILTGAAPWTSPEMVHAIEESARWFKAGYLGGSDYFSLTSDESIALMSDGRSPFFFSPSMAFQWATNYFVGDEAENFKFAPFPQQDPAMPYPIYDLGDQVTWSINANSKVKDGAALALDMMLSSEFAARIAVDWPGYWAVPLREFPVDPNATGLTKSYFEAMSDMMAAINKGSFGYKIQTFFPPTTSQVFVKEIEEVWLGQMTAEAMLEVAAKAYAEDKANDLVPLVPKPSF
ncbi:ABC transporter substrate-binding protein [Devosia sp. A449]